MTHKRVPYDEAATTSQMTADCRAVEDELNLPRRRTPAERAARAAVRPAPSMLYDDYPRDVPKPTIEISAAAARLAAVFQPPAD